MATIITLHGTNASGPEEGDRWWQRGSAFEADIRNLVEADDGRLEYSPLVWSGFNSEMARRAAAARLVERARELEQRGEKYCIIGHSHGGSVIAHALLIAADRKLSLPGLSRWISVGTPFIEPRRARMLFARLGVPGRSAYLTFLMLVFLFVIPAVFMQWRGAIFFVQTHPISIAAGTMLPLLVVYGGMLYLNRRKLHHYRPANLARARDLFGGRWRAFWHRNDEAVCGLRSMEGLNLAVFDRQFAVPIITLVTVFALPAALLTFVLLNHQQVLGSGTGGIAGAIGSNLPPEYTSYRLFIDALNWATLAAILGSLIYVASLLVTYLASKLASLFSGRISEVLNQSANAQLRARAFGYDAAGEIGVVAKAYPAWLAREPAPLPDDLAAEVSAISDGAAAASLAKFRGALSDLTFTRPGDRPLSLDAYLCWDELIHTAYFSVARFRKLVAYSIASAPGFSASPAFESDGDFHSLQNWSANEEAGAATPHNLQLQGASTR